MLFTNATVYRFFGEIPNLEQLTEALSELPARDCLLMEKKTEGFASPFGRNKSELVHQAHESMLFCYQSCERMLPSSAVKDETDDRVKVIEEAEQRKVRRKEMLSIKDDVIASLLPQAFLKRKRDLVYIDPIGRLMVINTAAESRADVIVRSLLRVLGALGARPLKHIYDLIPNTLTEWARNGDDLPTWMEISNEIKLVSTDGEGGNAVLKGHDHECQGVQELIAAGEQVERLRLIMKDRIELTLTDSLTFRRISFLDIIQEEIADRELETMEQKVSAELMIMVHELREMVALIDFLFPKLEPDRQ